MVLQTERMFYVKWSYYNFLVVIFSLFLSSYFVSSYQKKNKNVEEWRNLNYVPQKFIDTSMRHQLIYLRVQNMQKNLTITTTTTIATTTLATITGI